MPRSKIPWREAAVLVTEEAGGNRRIAGEGTLFAMVHRLKVVRREAWPRYSISLPDRQAAPVAFTASEFDDLISKHDRARM